MKFVLWLARHFDFQNCLVPISVELYGTGRQGIRYKQVQIFGFAIARFYYERKQ